MNSECLFDCCISDIDGLGSQDIGGQMLHDAHSSQSQKLLSMLTKSTAKAGEAGKSGVKKKHISCMFQLILKSTEVGVFTYQLCDPVCL